LGRLEIVLFAKPCKSGEQELKEGFSCNRFACIMEGKAD
jgi:hypothetical protein